MRGPVRAGFDTKMDANGVETCFFLFFAHIFMQPCSESSPREEVRDGPSFRERVVHHELDHEGRDDRQRCGDRLESKNDPHVTHVRPHPWPEPSKDRT